MVKDGFVERELINYILTPRLIIIKLINSLVVIL